MKLRLLIIAFFVIIATSAFAQDHGGHDDNVDSTKTELNVGEFIIEHISDAYDWHITTIGHTHISIPLPVIVFSKVNGLNIFMSSKFHENNSYKQFFISHEDDVYHGKIMEQLPDGTTIRPLDISITKNVLALFMVLSFLIWLFVSTANRYKNNPDSAPKGLQSMLEPLIIFIRDDIAKASIGNKYEKYLPFLLTAFFFIFLNNVMGLVPIFPGGYNLTGNIAVTMVLALFTFVITSISGTKQYWHHIFWSPVVPWWLKFPIPLMPIVEILGMFTKPFVLMIRLFANILGGHIVMLAFFSMIFIFGAINLYAGLGIGVLATVPFTIIITFLELLVAFIQAYVFTLLSAIYFGLALESDH
ncbi:MAG: F0F1 ATP synthase subunit A [Bacteroidales bacterium]|nr:F0F1 ATP synthase subunit A [Bacteroidales bacterium]